MRQIFLSYARKDGKDVAAKLRNELERIGFEVWRDIEDMRGGQAWKEQLRQAIKTVDVVLVLLTPGAVASKYVNWEWETAITVDKQVIPLLIMPCEVPSELASLHYHNLSTNQEYILGFASLIRDLTQISAKKSTKESVTEPSIQVIDSNNRSVSIGGTVTGNTIVTGDSNIAGNNNIVIR